MAGLAAAAQQTVGLGRRERRSGVGREGRRGGGESQQSCTRKGDDRWGKSAGLALRGAYSLLAMRFLPSIMLNNRHRLGHAPRALW